MSFGPWWVKEQAARAAKCPPIASSKLSGGRLIVRNYLTPFRLSLVTALIAGLTVTTVAGAAPTAKAAAFTAAGSARQVYATGVTAGAQVALLDGTGAKVATQTATPEGGVLFRKVKPGDGYRV